MLMQPRGEYHSMQEAEVQMARTLIVDDNADFRQRVRELMDSEPEIEVVGEAADGQDAILKARELDPDLVLMDVSMPGMNGIESTRRLKEEMPNVKVTVLTVFDIQEYREAAMASGASGYVVKSSLMEELMPSIRRAFGDV